MPDSGPGDIVVAVKPLDESRNDGWTNDKGRFCLPLSSGYYIAFPKKDETSPLFMAWFHTEMVGGSHLYRDAVRLAQEHHQRRILSSVKVVTARTTTIAPAA